ncbi:MAG: hypothetical protein ABFD14_12295 [Anaerolineaceae bacterium]
MEKYWLPYIPPTTYEPLSLPLGRYFPSIPPGMFSSWLQKNIPAGSIVVDPFCSSPLPALEAARAGYRVLVACNNPITRLFLKLLAESPTSQDIQSALAELASQKRGTERLEISLQSFYETSCPNCQQKIPAREYYWRREETLPYAKLIRCPICHWEGETAILEIDQEVLNRNRNDAMHRARALQVIGDGDEESLEGAQEAIDTYLPRQLSFLFTLLNKIQGLNLPPRRKSLLWALFILLCDEGNKLWSHPVSRTRPKQLSIPNEYREVNLWQRLEELAASWQYSANPIPIQPFQSTSSLEPGITLFQGRLRDLLPLSFENIPAAIISILPRPNQPYWTYSALWSGWIWGNEAVLPLKGSFHRKRYTWQWHANALSSSFHSLQSHLSPGIPFFALAEEFNPGFLAAIITASENTGLKLDGLAFQEEMEITQFHWETASLPEPSDMKMELGKSIHEGFRRCLLERAEPSGYASLFSAGMLQLIQQQSFARGQRELPFNQITLLNNQFSQVFTSRTVLHRYESTAKNQETGLYWLDDEPSGTKESLSDRIERTIRSILQKEQRITIKNLEEKLNLLFPGLLSPSLELIEMIIHSYALKDLNIPNTWCILSDENPQPRELDEIGILQTLIACAQKFGLSFRSEPDTLDWLTKDERIVFRYFVQSHACISQILKASEIDGEQGVIVLPGSRSNLLSYKIQKNPRLAEQAANGWHFLKFRHLRSLASRADLTLNEWKELLDADPPRWEQPQQLSIFNP